MPQPGEASRPQPSAEDSFLDLLVETLQGLDDSVRGQFLRQFFRTTAQIDLSETQEQRILGTDPAAAPRTRTKASGSAFR